MKVKFQKIPKMENWHWYNLNRNPHTSCEGKGRLNPIFPVPRNFLKNHLRNKNPGDQNRKIINPGNSFPDRKVTKNQGWEGETKQGLIWLGAFFRNQTLGMVWFPWWELPWAQKTSQTGWEYPLFQMKNGTDHPLDNLVSKQSKVEIKFKHGGEILLIWSGLKKLSRLLRKTTF